MTTGEFLFSLLTCSPHSQICLSSLSSENYQMFADVICIGISDCLRPGKKVQLVKPKKQQCKDLVITDVNRDTADLACCAGIYLGQSVSLHVGDSMHENNNVPLIRMDDSKSCPFQAPIFLKGRFSRISPQAPSTNLSTFQVYSRKHLISSFWGYLVTTRPK